MHRYRTAIVGLAIAVALLVLKQGIDLIAGSVSGMIASSFAYSLALAANFLALVAAACGGGRVRRAGIGYALCGWGYLFMATFEASPFAQKPPLITSLVFELIFGVNSLGGRGGGPDTMLWAAHATATIAAGLVGGWFAARLLLPDANLAPATPLRDFVRSLRPTPVERPAMPEADPIHPLDRSD